MSLLPSPPAPARRASQGRGSRGRKVILRWGLTWATCWLLSFASRRRHLSWPVKLFFYSEGSNWILTNKCLGSDWSSQSVCKIGPSSFWAVGPDESRARARGAVDLIRVPRHGRRRLRGSSGRFPVEWCQKICTFAWSMWVVPTPKFILLSLSWNISHFSLY